MNTVYSRFPQSRAHRASESGVALLTVLALLSIFAVVLVGFVYSLRMEENTVRQYSLGVNIQEGTEAAIQGVLSQVAKDLDPSQPHNLLGRPQPHYVSMLDPWANGYAGEMGQKGQTMRYDARSRQVDTRSDKVIKRTDLRTYPVPIPRGIDEDPPGDVSRDGAAGLKGIDDDLDGVVDNVRPGTSDKIQTYANDDDEDYRMDEDGLDLRRPDKSGQFYFTSGTGYDTDGDLMGVFDESAKININFAGNTAGTGGAFTYNLGVSPAELDMPLFLYNRVTQYMTPSGAVRSFTEKDAQQLAQNIVNYRYGSVADGGITTKKPGVDNRDDNGNNDPSIVQVEKYSQAYRTSQFNGEPYAVVGNRKDDDDDNLWNEEDERYIGATTSTAGGSSLSTPLNQDNVKYFRPGNRIDDNGNGRIDEKDEGIDDPNEFNVFKPKGDDRPYATIEDLKLVGLVAQNHQKQAIPGRPIFPTLYEILRDSTTIYGQSDEVSGPLSGGANEMARINPNLSSNWRATDLTDSKDPVRTAADRVDFQYGPPVHLDDLLALQVDNDGDWQLNAEPDVEKGQADGIDNDGDGLVDESSDDWDGNLYPSGDFDGFGEPDVGSPSLQNGPDHDGDGSTQDQIGSGDPTVGRLRQLGDTTKGRLRYEQDQKMRAGLVVEGNGSDDDGDNLVDDTGDFNGDNQLAYDPEWHVNDDAYGDLNADGYPGLGADPAAQPNTPEGDIIEDRSKYSTSRGKGLYLTNFADDDGDGFADFYDPQVLAAMYGPELDGIDNDNDGEVDEPGERYIACFDDDEDGRYDEDPPEFQLALNLMDFVDAWAPFTVTSDQDVQKLLSKSLNDPILSDPVTIRTFTLYSSRQRAFRMHPRILAGPNVQSREEREFLEQMRLLLPNPAQIGMRVKYEGVEAIRINEVMAKPVIRLFASEVLDQVVYNPSDTKNPVSISFKTTRFRVTKGADDDGQRTGETFFDSNWGPVPAKAANGSAAQPKPGYNYYPEGFRNTLNPQLPIVNLDTMAPAFIFGVTNAQVIPNAKDDVGQKPVEEAEWTFVNLPPGLYDVVIYLNPYHKYRPEVQYTLNEKVVSFRSDYAFGNVKAFDGAAAKPDEAERIRRDTARWKQNNSDTIFKLQYRLTPYPLPDLFRVGDRAQRVEVGSEGKLVVRITANAPSAGENFYETSFDRIELINPRAQYVELVNLSTQDIDLTGWTVNTPYGHYVLPEKSIIKRMKPSWQKDDGKELVANQGLPGTGVPYEPLLQKDKLGQPLSGQDLLLEDNKLLLAFDAVSLKQFIRDNYPSVPNLDERVVEPQLASNEKAAILAGIQNPKSGLAPNAQLCDLRFHVVDVQEDILTDNPADKYVTLYDPAGNYIDSFKYRTTFNNLIVALPSHQTPDLIALPGYRGFESFERTDPTYFETELSVDSKPPYELSGKRSVPTMKLDAKQAVLVKMQYQQDGTIKRQSIGGYARGEGKSDPNNPNLTRFSDQISFPQKDAHWGGWDFIGDYYEYPKDMNQNERTQLTLYNQYNAIAREAVTPVGADKVKFYQMMGGFENSTDFTILQAPNEDPVALKERMLQLAPLVAFTWRIGLRELVRAGFDPDVDSQLTVRVLGRQYINSQGAVLPIDMPVGEVLTTPVFRIINPGVNAIDKDPAQVDNPQDIFVNALGGSRQSKTPVFAKLRNGNTAFTINLREGYNDLWQDLKNSSDSEPIIEISVIMRKTSRDLSPGYKSREAGAVAGAIYPTDRPDFLATWFPNRTPIRPNVRGDYVAQPQNAQSGVATLLGGMGDDNYFFKGIELFGRGRKSQTDTVNDRERRQFLAGTPGRDNTGYVPAYPRRRWKLDGSSRDANDLIDNTAYVKNGLLATVGEISRLHTGNKFETVNTPIIPQRLEDKAVDKNRIQPNPGLAERAERDVNNNPFRIQLAQRERLDQWENQYPQLYNMITVSENGIRPGLININTAPREVLVALPFTPLKSPGELERLQDRHFFNTIVADYIIEGRQPGGHDLYFGVHDLFDDEPYAKFYGLGTKADTLPDYKRPSVGRPSQGYKKLEDTHKLVFEPLQIKQPTNVKGDPINYTYVFRTTIVSEPDDGPYPDVGTLFSQLTHLKRRERYSQALSKTMERTGDYKPDYPGDVRERLKLELQRDLTPEDMEEMMNRISNLVTVRSRAFGIVTRGRMFDSDNNIVAQRKLETVYTR